MADAPNPMKSNPYPHSTVKGTPRSLGQQHGEQTQPQIRGFLVYLRATLKWTREQLRLRAMQFQPLFMQHAPHLVDEIRGLAEGASIPFEDALAVQIRGELAPIPDGACTTFVISSRGTASNQVLIGQNSDVEPKLEEFAYVLRVVHDQQPTLMMWTFGGMIGYHGMNSAGVSHFANSLGGGPMWKMGLPHYPLKRLMLEQRSLDDAINVMRRLPICSSGNYVLCDGDGRIADIELTPDGFARLDDNGEGFIAHSNHFVCGAYACQATNAASVPDSFARLNRMRHLLAHRFGRLTDNDLKIFLSDHAGVPTAICRHSHEGRDHPSVSSRGRTVASIIAEPMEGRMYVARGNPCCADFRCYYLP